MISSVSILFLAFTFIWSFLFFTVIYFWPKMHSPDSLGAILLWLGMVWGPSLGAFWLWSRQGSLVSQISELLQWPSLTIWHLIIFIPFVVLGVIAFSQTESNLTPVSFFHLVLLIGINLVMGPLGEELGWRGFLLPKLIQSLGWLGAALVVGLMWSIWHAPLWLIESPQSKIPFLVFCANVICFSILMTIVWMQSGGSIWPVVLFHLFINLSTNLAEIIGATDASSFYSHGLVVYAIFTLLVVGFYELTKDQVCYSA